jgi:hypothetical protein
VESILTLTTEEYEEVPESEEKSTAKTRPVSSRQVKVDKKKAKKQRALEKHRAQIIAAAGKTSTKKTEEKSSDPPANNEQPQGPPVDMEFIRI